MQINTEAVVRPEFTKEWQMSPKVRQDKEPHPLEKEQHERSFDSVNIKYLKFDNVKSIVSTKLVKH